MEAKLYENYLFHVAFNPLKPNSMKIMFWVMGSSWHPAVGLQWSAVVWPASSICRESCWRQNMGVPNLSTMIRVVFSTHWSLAAWTWEFPTIHYDQGWDGQYLAYTKSPAEGRTWVFPTSPLSVGLRFQPKLDKLDQDHHFHVGKWAAHETQLLGWSGLAST